MGVKLKWPVLGIIIPCVLISTLAYGSHYFVLKHQLSTNHQLVFEGSVCILWISYLLAIYGSPGSPPANFKPQAGEWRRWCKKCSNYKPERTHHCKQCKKCVLMMDHHCPWTYNCVGYGNMGHFMRFSFWVLVDTAVVAVQLFKRAVQFYHDRDLPSYLFDKKELVAVILLFPIDLFVFVSILILYIRCIANWGFKGMSQIEVWELERIESQFHTERIWLQIRKNYFKLHGKAMPVLISWNQNLNFRQQDRDQEQEELEQEQHELQQFEEEQFEDPMLQGNEEQITDPTDSVVPENFTVDDLVFPYDLGLWGNLITIFNYPWFWLFPLAKPPSSGYHFEKNEFAEDDQLGLPWPPDGGHQEFEPDPEIDIDNLSANDLRNIQQLRRRLDPRSRMNRTDWMNDMGETLDDYGVDLEAEDVEHDDLLALTSNS